LAALRDWPSVVVPLTVGTDVFVGATGGGGGGIASIAAVAADVADAEPPSLLAVTTTRSVSPTSPAVSV
jgi:hypothetical protein